MPESDPSLVELTPELAEDVVSWVHSAADVVMFAGASLPYPLTAAALLAATAQQGRVVRVLVGSGRPVAFGSLLPRADDLRLGWVLADPACRGQGWGRRLVTALIDLARADGRTQKVTLGVYLHNTVARALYADLGFVEAGEQAHTEVDGDDWVSIGMELSLPVHAEEMSVRAE